MVPDASVDSPGAVQLACGVLRGMLGKEHFSGRYCEHNEKTIGGRNTCTHQSLGQGEISVSAATSA